MDAVRSGRGTRRAEDAQGTLTQSNILPSILEFRKIKRERVCANDSISVKRGWAGAGRSGRGAARAEANQGTLAQSHISPSILVCRN